jgi:D-alanyl-D-alanine endopeptidase (penicillin-binding protein 7)
MSPKLFNFLSSFGVMLAGVVLLFVGSAGFEIKKNPQFLSFPQSQARAQSGGDITPAVLPKSSPTIPLKNSTDAINVTTTAAVVLVVDDNTDTVLFEKNAATVRPLASITKLMSALVLLDLPIDWSTTTVVLAQDCDNSSHHINPGEKFELNDLLKIALVGSSNSAINVLVRASSNTLESFTALMNDKARALGLTSARFTDPTGLDSRNMANAADVAQLLKVALSKEKIFSALQTSEYYAQPIGKKLRRIWSTDWLLTRWIPSNYDKVKIAGKTGYIYDSDYNFVVKLTDKKNHSVRVVILGSASNETRFTEARDTANWVFAHYLWPEDEGYSELVES